MSKSKTFLAVAADPRGEVFEHPDLLLAGMNGCRVRPPRPDEMIPLPEGSRLFTLPGMAVQGFDRRSGQLKTVDSLPKRWGGGEIEAVAAFLAPAYMRTLLPAADFSLSGGHLPLWAYTAVGWCLEEQRFYAAAVRVDKSSQWDPDKFDDRLIEPRTRRMMKEQPDNRLLEQLARCALDYHCFAAKNLFLGRWEAPLPTSPVCNAACLGCISLQESECCPASQERITFVPTVEEICGIAVPHLREAENAIVSFGQGCEGEPILQAGRICESVREMRRLTSRGTINFNTNGSLPEEVDRLAEAGIDSIRVSLNSVRESCYQAYYRPRCYSFREVVDSVHRAKRNGLFTMLNYLVFPGVSDLPEEVETLICLVEEAQVDMIQMRNLSIDPSLYACAVGLDGEGMGMKSMLDHIKNRVPRIQFGYFNRTRESFYPPGFEGDWATTIR
ncbi:MAG: radical SAM protein [Desulfuromonadaceae bacterium]|nr:radical SAM protein [Desulfuromonadaceae bacterium]